jgi:hypothetical protein
VRHGTASLYHGGQGWHSRQAIGPLPPAGGMISTVVGVDWLMVTHLADTLLPRT